jgi:hypothetical protein
MTLGRCSGVFGWQWRRAEDSLGARRTGGDESRIHYRPAKARRGDEVIGPSSEVPVPAESDLGVNPNE